MKAVLYDSYGPPEVLYRGEAPKPVPGHREVLIRVVAVECTKSDCELRGFTFPVKWFWLPLRLALGVFRPRNKILGSYFAGVVEATGKGVTRFRVGDRLFGSSQLRFGAYGEYLALPETCPIVIKPHRISFAEAAAVPLGGLNALHFINRADIQPGQKVLINGAGASIGSHAIQIAKSKAAEVTAVDAAHKRQCLLDLGADHFIDYQSQDFLQLDQRWDVIFNVVAGRSYSACMARLNPGGRLLIANPRLSDFFKARFSKPGDNKRAVVALAPETVEALNALSALIEDGRIRPLLDSIFYHEQAAQAQHRVEKEQRLGCVVLALDPEKARES